MQPLSGADMGESNMQQSYGVHAASVQEPQNTALPGAGAQPVSVQPAAPIADMLKVLRGLRRVCMDVQEANLALAGLTLTAVSAQPDLASQLAAFGWNANCQRWACRVDLPGIQACLKKFKYARLQQLGHGAYGVVYKAQDIETGRYFAVKKLLANDTSSSIREITTLRELSHPNIIRLHDVIAVVGGAHVYLVLDCHDCDLKQHLSTCPGGAHVDCVKSIMYQLLQGVAHMHANSIIHRDLKPQNILMEQSTGRVVISDFGLARTFLPPLKPYTEKMVTLYYRAPELLLGCPTYSRAVDLWSAGCIMAELLTGQPLFPENTEVALIMRLCQTLGTPTEDQWPGITQLMYEDLGAPLPHWPHRCLSETIPALQRDAAALDLITKLLTYDPTHRISAAAALRHPWFHGVQLPTCIQYAAMPAQMVKSHTSFGEMVSGQTGNTSTAGTAATSVLESQWMHSQRASVSPAPIGSEAAHVVADCQPTSYATRQLEQQAARPQGVMQLLRPPTRKIVFTAVRRPVSEQRSILNKTPAAMLLKPNVVHHAAHAVRLAQQQDSMHSLQHAFQAQVLQDTAGLQPPTKLRRICADPPLDEHAIVTFTADIKWQQTAAQQALHAARMSISNADMQCDMQQPAVFKKQQQLEVQLLPCMQPALDTFQYMNGTHMCKPFLYDAQAAAARACLKEPLFRAGCLEPALGSNSMAETDMTLDCSMLCSTENMGLQAAM